jgi:hypothetical protein
MNVEHVNFARRVECEEDGLYFNRYFFKQRFDAKLIVSAHHAAIQNALDRTMLPPSDPEFIPRLIINVPPGYTKTELASIGYMARGLALNPGARFLHLSYSDRLALLNSATSRKIVKSKQYQSLWDVATVGDVDSKSVWHTTAGGGVTASAAGGQVTGFRAGHMDADKFTGALIIDDPVKPGDADSEVKIQGIMDNYSETIASRVAIESVPIIVIMQRIVWKDLAGFLLRGGSGEMWHHLNLPVIIDNSEPYPEKNTHGIPIDHGLPDGWLWPYKHNEKHETALKAHRRKWRAQYKQNPPERNEETALFHEESFKRARLLHFSEPSRTIIAIDPATTNNPKSDLHGIIAATSYGKDEYSVDADYSRKGKPSEWAFAAMEAHKQHDADAIIIETNQGGDMCVETLRNAGYKGHIIRVHASKGKTLRAEPIAALYEQDFVSHKAGLGDAEEEMLNFDPITQLSDGKSPNRLDAVVYALTELSGGIDLAGLLKMAMG